MICDIFRVSRIHLDVARPVQHGSLNPGGSGHSQEWLESKATWMFKTG